MFRKMELLDADKNQLITKSNKLIEANYKLGVIEQKIILCLASTIQPTDFDFKTYKLSIKEFHKLLGLKGTPKYTELRQITKELMQKVFEIRIDKKVIQASWLSYVAYNETEGTIEMRFDPFLRPYLLELKKEFTSYKLENIVKIKSSYSIRLYELLKQYEKIQERTFLLSDLRKVLGVENIYPAYGNFKQRVLIPAQKELKKKTDIHFKIEEIKVGRRVEKLKFIISSIYKEEDAEPLSLYDENTKETEKHSFVTLVKHAGMGIGVVIPENIINSWERYGKENVLKTLEMLKDRRDIENPIGYISTLLKFSKNPDYMASPSQEEQVLAYLISYFRKSKEPKTFWFIKDCSIELIQQHYNISEEDTLTLFEKIKIKLCANLKVEILELENSNQDFEKKKKKLEEKLKKYK